MPTTPEGFARRIDRLRADLVEQGRRAATMLNEAVEAAFERDLEKARRVIEQDALIDKVDVEIERASVRLLSDAVSEGAALDEESLRAVLTIVKVNNELERIADGAVDIAEMVEHLGSLAEPMPGTVRVMANSVIGTLQTTNTCLATMDTAMAKSVLASDDTIDEFERVVLRDTQRQVAEGRTEADFAFALHAMASGLERINDHCTNIAEQVIYVATGRIVRHQGGHWSEPEQPPA